VKVLSKTKEWNQSLLDQVWDGSQGIHEHDKRIIYSALIDLAPSLVPDHRFQLLNKICGVPVQEYDVHLFDVIMNFTNACMDAVIGLDFFWNNIGPETKITSELAEKAVENLCLLLGAPNYANQRSEYTSRCMRIIDQLQAIIILQKIIDSEITKKRKKVIDSLQETHKILDLIITSILNYKN